MRQNTMKTELFLMYFNTKNASVMRVSRREYFHIYTLSERWSEKEHYFSTSCFSVFFTLEHCKTTQSFPVSTVSRPKGHLCPVPGSGRFPLMDIVGMLQRWSSSSPPRTLKIPCPKSWRISEYIMSADLKNYQITNRTTSGYHSAQWPVAGSQEEQCHRSLSQPEKQHWTRCLSMASARQGAEQCNVTQTLKLWETTTPNGWHYQQGNSQLIYSCDKQLGCNCPVLGKTADRPLEMFTADKLPRTNNPENIK